MNERIAVPSIVACLLLAGCLSGPSQDPTVATIPAGRWAVNESLSLAVGWRPPPDTEHPISLQADRSNDTTAGVMDVQVANLAEPTLGFGGSGCSIHLAKPQNGTWVIFAASPNSMDGQYKALPRGDDCQARVHLESMITAGPSGEDGAAPRIPPGDYQVVFLANTGRGEDLGTVLAHTPITVR